MSEPRLLVGELTIRANKEKGVIEFVIPNPQRHVSLTLQLWPDDVRDIVEGFIAASEELGAE